MKKILLLLALASSLFAAENDIKFIQENATGGFVEKTLPADVGDFGPLSADQITTGTLNTDRLPTTIEATLIPRNGTDAVIDTVVLDTGEIAVTTDTGQIRVGDNSTLGGAYTFGSLNTPQTVTGVWTFDAQPKFSQPDALYLSNSTGTTSIVFEATDAGAPGDAKFSYDAKGKFILSMDGIGTIVSFSLGGDTRFLGGELRLGDISSAADLYLNDGSSHSALIQTVNLADSRAYNIPDAGANANFVMSEGTQTINGSKNFSGGLSADTLALNEQSADPADPAEGASVMWQSDGTGFGDDGDVVVKITAGSVTKTHTLIDFSAITDEQP